LARLKDFLNEVIAERKIIAGILFYQIIIIIETEKKRGSNSRSITGIGFLNLDKRGDMTSRAGVTNHSISQMNFFNNR
jgi:hypothetical protein